MSIKLIAGQSKELSIGLTSVYIPPEPAALYGRVEDVDTGYAIAGVLIEVVGTGLLTYTWQVIPMLGKNYEITDIPAGTYTIRFSHVDYETLEVEMVTLTEGQTKELNIGLALVYVPPQLANLFGVVADTDTGYAVAGVLVEIVGTGLSTMTASDGNYQIADIPAGTYTIRFSHVDYETLEV